MSPTFSCTLTYRLTLMPLILGCFLFFILCGAPALFAQDSDRAFIAHFNTQHQMGARLGGWRNLGDTPLRERNQGSSSILSDFKSGSFYLEGYYSHRFSRLFAGELSIGIVNRGDVTVNNTFNESFYGSLVIYPILIKAKVYPFAASLFRFQPYFTIGGGFFHGRHDIQLARSDFYYSDFNEDTETKLGYSLGGGIDYPLARPIGLELTFSYMPFTFSKPLVFVQDYSGLSIMIGVKYLYTPTKKNDSAVPSRRRF